MAGHKKTEARGGHKFQVQQFSDGILSDHGSKLEVPSIIEQATAVITKGKGKGFP